LDEITIFDDDVSSNHITVFPPGKAALLKWLLVQIPGMKEA
jgi:hypothetical protein